MPLFPMRAWLAMVLAATACAPSGRSTPPPEAARAPAARQRPLEAGDRAPPFVVQTADGAAIDSADVLGKRPLVLVFFTTWCPWCERSMPLLRQGLAGAPADVLVVGVSLDDETWSDVPEYMAQHQLSIQVVRAMGAREFTAMYDPGGRIPHVVVVGRDGKVIDVQPGYDPDQVARLRGALELAGPPPPAAR